MAITKAMVHFRAEQMCLMYMTRRKEIRPLPPNLFSSRMNAGIDLLFDLEEDDFYTGCLFGVTLKASNNGVDPIKKIIRDFKTQKYKHIVYPVLLVAFDMSTDKGYYIWVNSPQPDRNLLTPSDLKVEDIHQLNNRSLAQIIKKINAFYKR
jgi:hypothetical protein